MGDMIDRRLPLYLRLRDTIAGQIASTVWRPGQAIPTEAELAAANGVAIGTVRKAIDVLVADGLVERNQGRGTFVRRPSFDNSLLRFLRHQRPDGGRVIPESRILSRVAQVAPETVGAALKLPPGSPVIRLGRLRLIDSLPVLAETIWLPQVRFHRILDLPLGDFEPLLYPLYERLCCECVAAAEEILSVETVDRDTAKLLDLAEGAAAVVIERLAFGYDGRPLEWRRSLAPAATFRYRVDIR